MANKRDLRKIILTNNVSTLQRVMCYECIALREIHLDTSLRRTLSYLITIEYVIIGRNCRIALEIVINNHSGRDNSARHCQYAHNHRREAICDKSDEK